MADRPIIFSAPMVRALLDGRKTQTRRLATSPLRRCEVGDRLYVRETFGRCPECGHVNPKVGINRPSCCSACDAVIADFSPSIHMPRWGSRLTLLVEAVRFEGLLDISEEDAAAEGFAPGLLDDGFGPIDMGGGVTMSSPGTWASAAGHFQLLWQELHPEWDGYSDVPIVALTFRVVHGNIDQVPA